MSGQVKTANSLTLVAGLWLVLSAFFMGLGVGSTTFVVGALIVIFSLVELFSMESTMWASWVNGILGAWLVISAFAFAGLTAGALWNSIILGVIVVALALWAGMSSSTMGHGHHPKMG